MSWDELRLFQEERHLAFHWPGGRSAALLVHGFPGTPAEMRPLARLLQPLGWTVEGLLLPGFGAQFATLGQRRYEEWLGAVTTALTRLQAAGHAPLMLAGFSMGGALAVAAATTAGVPLDGVILLAPFTWRQNPFSTAARALLGPLAPRSFRPFHRADLRDPRTRTLVLSALPGVDLDQPLVQDSVRRLEVPTALVAQIFRAGWRAWRHAPELRSPTLIIQGRYDETVPAWRTRLLARRLPNVAGYLEVDAGHRLIGDANLAWPTVQETVMDFAVRLEEGYRP